MPLSPPLFSGEESGSRFHRVLPRRRPRRTKLSALKPGWLSVHLRSLLSLTPSAGVPAGVPEDARVWGELLVGMNCLIQSLASKKMGSVDTVGVSG